MHFFRKSFEGRLNRRNYFFWLSLYILLLIIFQNIVTKLTHSLFSPFAWIYSIVFAIPFIFAAIVFGVSLHVKRFHDLGYSGHLTWLGLIPVLNVILGTALLFQKGQNKHNRYGNMPYARVTLPFTDGNKAFTVMVGMVIFVLLTLFMIHIIHSLIV